MSTLERPAGERVEPSMAPGTVWVDVLSYDAPCERCGKEFDWVFGLLPSYRPRGDEFTSVDFPGAVELARRILLACDGEDFLAEIADRLGPRPAWQHGRSYNPNRCPHCGHHAGWHTLWWRVMVEAYHRGGWTVWAEGRVPLATWAGVCGAGQGVAWHVPEDN